MDSQVISEKFYGLDKRLTAIEWQHGELTKIVATQTWVKDQLGELSASFGELSASSVRTESMLNGVLESYKQLLAERGQREKDEHAEKIAEYERKLVEADEKLKRRSFLGLVGTTREIVTALVAIIVLFGALSAAVTWVVLYVAGNK
jgi:hypothetical protein